MQKIFGDLKIPIHSENEPHIGLKRETDDVLKLDDVSNTQRNIVEPVHYGYQPRNRYARTYDASTNITLEVTESDEVILE